MSKYDKFEGHTPGPWKSEIYTYPLADSGDYTTEGTVYVKDELASKFAGKDRMRTLLHVQIGEDDDEINLKLAESAPVLLAACTRKDKILELTYQIITENLCRGCQSQDNCGTCEVLMAKQKIKDELNREGI